MGVLSKTMGLNVNPDPSLVIGSVVVVLAVVLLSLTVAVVVRSAVSLMLLFDGSCCSRVLLISGSANSLCSQS